ncbi:MAG: winged helix-turn-helix transcriptional regulator [Deltaproteobacteria bacterium]|nr:winged helix-turn-helix transcriptional regulator [Deltaproteobacteria bacterium]MBW2119568.1 winged helix-turn-helix transcriptional regulator [Deltaproteobacteria bacterium]MBW2343365.1 winged helix-turn-helix transcriptional regulator [Deltaproteobacteria bacterium]
MKRKQDDVCEVIYVNREKVLSVRERMKPETTIQRLAETFRVLGDPTRVKILFALAQEELCVCDIANLLGTTNSAVSHQLRVLRNMRLVRYRKEGKMAYYALDDDHIRHLFDEGLNHVEEMKV